MKSLLENILCSLSCIESEGTVYSEPSKIAEILNFHFSTIGSKLTEKFKFKFSSFDGEFTFYL